MQIVTVEKGGGEAFLRRKTAPFDFARFSKKEIAELLRAMRAAMKAAQGVGLAANQVGLDIAVFVAQVENKFYAVFNPEITAASADVELLDEGCLSVPGAYGATPRATRVTLAGYDKNGKKIKIKAWGLLARVFQHEVDHLNGVLFIDKARDLRKYENERKYENA
ncbi:MAG: peptide deformylase [Candidatus Harrisonbacteria bacterium]|nr:peptide deformylase [Candidatus Harrisonbacteria bacterium]